MIFTDDMHSLKTVQETFFRVATVITQTNRSHKLDDGASDETPAVEQDGTTWVPDWQSDEGHRLAELVARFLPADQMCAPYVPHAH